MTGEKTVDDFHRELGHCLWENVGMTRNEEGLKRALEKIGSISKDFHSGTIVPGSAEGVNDELTKAMMAADFISIGELITKDALQRQESCGGHFREESQTPSHEAQRNDENFSHVQAWEYSESGHLMIKEPLTFEHAKPATRNYA